jgi:hypothetical protein
MLLISERQAARSVCRSARHHRCQGDHTAEQRHGRLRLGPAGVHHGRAPGPGPRSTASAGKTPMQRWFEPNTCHHMRKRPAAWGFPFPRPSCAVSSGVIGGHETSAHHRGYGHMADGSGAGGAVRGTACFAASSPAPGDDRYVIPSARRCGTGRAAGGRPPGRHGRRRHPPVGPDRARQHRRASALPHQRLHPRARHRGPDTAPPPGPHLILRQHSLRGNSGCSFRWGHRVNMWSGRLPVGPGEPGFGRADQ